MNRSDFLIRLLSYYADTHCKYSIFIADASNPEHVKITKNALKQLNEKLHIMYYEYPGLSIEECTRRLIQLVSTPYVVFVADDDFLITNGLEQCVQFLENHPDYIAAHGMAVRFRLRSNGSYGKFLGCSPYKLPVIEANTASQRLIEHLQNYSVTLFCVHRIEGWRAMYPDDVHFTDKAFGAELLPCCLSVIYGKIKQLNSFYLMRQDHSKRYLLPDVDTWVQGSTWKQEYKIFRNRLAQELMRIEKISEADAAHIVDTAFQSYLDTFCKNYKTRIQNAFASIPGIRYVLRMLKYIWFNRSGDLSLPMLLRSTSPYHNDFMPAYRSITIPSELVQK